MTTLFSFVGTNPYAEADYTFEDRRLAGPERFTQAALVQLLPEESRPSQVCLALTRLAREKNWSALQLRLKELGYADAQLRTIDIPDGSSESEIWEIFEQLSDIAKGPVIFDATHGFRALPLVATLALPFQGERSGFHIERLVYGMFDPNRPNEPTPIIDLSVMLDLPVWQQAVNDFKFHGRARGLEERLRRPVQDLGRQLRHHAPRELTSLPGSLARLSDSLSVNRVDQIPELAQAVLYRLKEAAGQIDKHPTAKILRPLSRSVRELIEVVEPLAARPDEEPVEAQLRLAVWYADRELFASALTTLREAVTDAIVDLALRVGVDHILSEGKRIGPDKSKFRMKVDGIFTQLAASREYRDPENEQVIADIAVTIERNPSLREVASAVSVMVEQRNKLNHGYKGQQETEDASKMVRDKRTGVLALHKDILGYCETVRQLVTKIQSAK